MTALVSKRWTGKSSDIPFMVRSATASGTILQPLNSSMISVAIVGIGAHVGSSSDVSWVISSMYIATAVCAPMAGRLGTLFGARRVFITGLALVCVASVIGMFAPNIGWLVAAYVLLGIGLSVHMPNAMTIVRGYTDKFGGEPRSAIAMLVACGQSIAAVGPAVGGILVGTFGWQSILWINLPVAAISAIAILRIKVDVTPTATGSYRSTVRALDLLGAILFVALITSAMVFLISLRDSPAWWCLPVAGIALAVFLWWELRRSAPFLDVRALSRNRTLSATLIRTLMSHTCFYCVFFGFPQWLQYARGMDPAKAGLMMLSVAGMSVVATMLASQIYHRFGPRVTLLAGSISLLIGGLLVVVAASSTAPLIALLLIGGVLGLPSGFNHVGNQTLINSVTAVDEVGMATGMNRTAAFTGANVAVVVLQLTAGAQVDDVGMHRTGWFIVVISVLLTLAVATSRNMGPHRTRGARKVAH